MRAIQRDLSSQAGLTYHAPVERRGSPRFHTVLRMARVMRDCDVGLWRVRNISNQGMMLGTQTRVSPGESLRIDLSQEFSLKAKAVWHEDGRCGVMFDRPIECEIVLSRLAAQQREPGYRSPRLEVEVPAVAYCDSGLHGVRVLDVSRRGVGVSHDGCFRPGMATKLLFENGEEHRGVVRWSEMGRAGIFLIEPIPCEKLESARSFAPVPLSRQ